MDSSEVELEGLTPHQAPGSQQLSRPEAATPESPPGPHHAQEPPPSQPTPAGKEGFAGKGQVTRRGVQSSGEGIITAKGFLKEGAPKKAFSTGVFQCWTNCSLCCVGICCTTCLYGDNYSRVHGSGCVSACMLCTFCPFFACCFASELRLELRSKYGLERDHNDFLLHTLCSPCAICQEARELLALRVGMERV
ncbi:MAG: hypothetical protein WDW38_000322 [Sanguina aurantia]